MFKGDLMNKGIMREEMGYYILRQSMPWPLAENNAYLIESSNGWSIIDVGVDLESTREVWELAIKEAGISFKHIKNIYVTHCHPDHLGAARWLQQKTGAPVYMLAEEIIRAREFIFLRDNFEQNYRQAIHNKVTSNRFPQRWEEALIQDWQLEVAPFYPEPAELLPLYEGDIVDLRGDKFQVMQAPGHSDGQYILWCAQNRIVFLADVMVEGTYLHFADWPHSHLVNPLADFLNSMDKLQSLDIAGAFPGHGPTLNYLDNLIHSLRKRHNRALDKVEQAVVAPISAGELYTQMYELIDYVHLHRVVMGETLGYLAYLVSQGRLDSWQDNGHILFAPRSDKR